MTQFALFDEAPSQPSKPKPDAARARLEGLLAELEAAEVMPWTEADLHRWSTVFPQICKWLPAAEADRFAGRFQHQMTRFQQSIAA
jgi:hypothetical protein